VKRAFDVSLGTLLLVLGAPLMAGVALAVRWRLGAPVLFRQQRPGRGERLFTLLKFRTMRDGDAPDAERLTPLGRFLRRTCLDELPELFNVLRGDMSLVGPRPLLERYLPHYTAQERTRHRVRPGLTGWAQVHDHQRLSWDERLAMDRWYVEHRSWRLDLRILLCTAAAAFKRRSVVDAPHLNYLDEERLAHSETNAEDLGAGRSTEEAAVDGLGGLPVAGDRSARP
jgi:lipopolysaccharide/colanic/teichoic acid biosynthesis glycosyltransferase